MRVLIVDHDELRCARVVEGLGANPELRIQIVSDTFGLVERVAAFSPDMIVVACDAPARDAIEGLRRVSVHNPRPIVMFVDRSEPELAEEAIRAGVAAYVVDGLEPGRIRGVLDMARVQFAVTEELRRDLAKAKADLAGRKLIERAKGKLMAAFGFDEPTAFARLRRAAMDRGATLSVVAEDYLDGRLHIGDKP